MSSLNKVMIIGRLGADPDVRYTQSNTAVANMSVATTDRYKDRNGELQEKTEWHRVVVWNRLAEICQQYLKKGSLVYFEGKLETREWEDKEGQKRYTTEVKAFNMQMLDSRGDQGGGSPQQNSGGGKPASAQSVNLGDDFDDMDDDLPF
ncbi:single-stranded DNA-binding protein [Rhodohalobacter halophilus]|uniref:single-stranded DNA-binding protein n=1 Tax=Rhodohalobacter halophilus TaxID=1812810 RepID=UPI00083F8340|nr:single-stranded DNA-binding protein [Rhodohalobacter halophilus]